ncbi:DddA-like double-stranded DNA deaminase toxin [Allokutzneria oryzae]|uniref:DddA-like double-stranded DNA deaminase toxin n=1 Tax=Allokutzneria oryzae TaxID=1378989 RepID=A0ABV5ZWZ0_9PSEU
MSLREVAAAARAALAMLPTALLDEAETALDKAATHWHHATEGSVDDDVPYAHSLFETALDDLRRVRHLLHQLPERVESWISGLGVSQGLTCTSSSPPTASSTPESLRSPGSDTPTRHEGDPGAAARERLVEHARTELPPTVVPRSRTKTHGRWTDGGVVHALVSGRDDTAALADRLLAERGMPGRSTRTADAELKVAAIMANGGPRHVTVAINNTPCRGPYSCDTLAPILLPTGATLTVIGADGFRKTYTGGATPWWS